MSLPQCQRAFMAQVLEEDSPLPSGWNAGMSAGLAIYRNAYRARLLGALGETFPRTQQWVGEENFARAAAHHLIQHPPGQWSLDHAGKGFPGTLAQVFASDPEVSELAALEWDMHMAFVATDFVALDRDGFALATAEFGEEDWAGLRLMPVPGLVIRPLRSAAIAIWSALAAGEGAPTDMLLERPTEVLVWRDGLTPVFRSAAPEEAACLRTLMCGGSFGAVCEFLAERRRDASSAAAEAGTMLQRWLEDGLLLSAAKG